LDYVQLAIKLGLERVMQFCAVKHFKKMKLLE